MTAKTHIPVMLKEVVAALQPSPGKIFIDATLGAAGHAMALLSAGATVIGLDRDEEIIKIAETKVKASNLCQNFRAFHKSFSQLADVVTTPVDGILFDLGVSSYQLDTARRGFSFRYDAPLDMRMDKSLTVTASDLINGLGKKELYELFTTLGEEYRCRRLIDAIITTRKVRPITKTGELVALINETLPRTNHLHPATKIFQALRMAVNSEREELKAALPSALSCLAPNGILAVISFHSGEDEIVKTFFRAHKNELEPISKKPLLPTNQEIQENPRSRSAKLRLGRKKA